MDKITDECRQQKLNENDLKKIKDLTLEWIKYFKKQLMKTPNEKERKAITGYYRRNSK